MGKLKKTIMNLTVLMIIVAFMSLGCVSNKETPSDEEKSLSEEDITELVRQSPTVLKKENIGGKYNSSILTVYREYNNTEQTWEQIEYTIDNQTITGDLYPNIRDALEWIRFNTPEDAVIMSWWDYADSIKGYTGRDIVIDFVSEDLLYTISMYEYASEEQQKEMEERCVPHNKIEDVAAVMTETDSHKAIQIMEKYNSNYLFIQKNDGKLSWIFFSVLEKSPIETDTEEFEETIIGKASKGKEIEGFELAYSDENFNLYVTV